VPAGAALEVGEGVDENLFGTLERDNGSIQVTYNGWPLYLFSIDRAAGATNGHKLDDRWYLVDAAGTAIGAAASESGEDLTLAELDADFDPVAAFEIGRGIYANNCAACHGMNGEGVVGPALDGRERVGQNPTIANTILYGISGYMPGFAALLDDAQAAALATYIRGAWTNSFDPLPPSEIAKWR
jgi:mono/diheme cytochrome c family protein